MKKNEWDHRMEATVKEGPADCIRWMKLLIEKLQKHGIEGN